MSEDNTILLIAVLAVVASLTAAGFSYYTATNEGQNILSGFATSTSTGTANLTIESAIQINFSVASINWGSGRVSVNKQYAILSTEGEMFQGNWTTLYQGLVLDNIGNVNVSLSLAAGKTAAQFIGGGAGTIPDPAYTWKITDNLTGSCTSVSAAGYGAYADVNTTASGTLFCGGLRYEPTSNKINVHINITVPIDATPGAHGDIITATGIA